MTLILFASIAGAALFFAAGAALMALRSHRTTDDVARQVQEGPTLVRRVDPELARLRAALAAAEATVASQATVIDEQNRLWERDTDDKHAVVTRELAKLRADNDRLHKEAVAAAATNQELRRTAEERAKQLEAAAATNQELRRTAEDRAKQIDRTRTDAVASATELTQLQTKLRDVERQLADKNASVRDLSTENEQLKGRLRDADALRTEYVRLRTATTDSEYLKSEIARLENELRAVRVDALGAQPRQRPARGTDRQPTAAERSIGESLASVIERFADAGTRSSALGDRQGFPLASSGADGVALAAYAAHLFESASRAKEYLPVEAPSAIEIVDANGVRVSVWALEVEGDRLMLANLAVSPVDQERVETTLGALSQILAPSTLRASGARP